jgi:hypothetical protein
VERSGDLPTSVLLVLVFESEMPETEVVENLLAAALGYAAGGLPVAPLYDVTTDGRCGCRRPGCDRPGKHPRLRHGLLDASTDPAILRRWWSAWPSANIGLSTGVHVDVCDVDSPAGLRTLLAAVPDRGLALAPVVRTGSGGWHLYVAATGLGNRVRLLPDVDWRGAGGYVVAPPSLHSSGRRYRWERGAGPLDAPVCPAGLLRLVAGDRPTVAARSGGPHGPRYGEAALAGEAARVAGAAAGTRNDTLNRAAFALGQLVAEGLLDSSDVSQALAEAAHTAGLGRTEVVRTVRSGLRAGLRRPRRRAA